MRSKVNYHTGVGGTMFPEDEYRAIVEGGGAIIVKSVNDSGKIMDACLLAREYPDPTRNDCIVLRYTNPMGYHDIPNYKLEPRFAAQQFMIMVGQQLAKAPELIPFKGEYYIQIVNEPRWEPDYDDPNYMGMHPMAWLAVFGERCIELARELGWKIVLFGLNAGTPYEEDWYSPEMASMIRAIGGKKDVLIGFNEGTHERFGDYRTDAAVSSKKWYDYQSGVITTIGRMMHVIDMCHDRDLPIPYFVVSEFAWRHDNMPDYEKALADLRELDRLYLPMGVLGVFLWAVHQSDHIGNLKDKMTGFQPTLIERHLKVAQYDFELDEEIPPIDPPEDTGNPMETLLNLSFENGHTDDPLQPDRRQIPTGFELSCVGLGSRLWYGKDKYATGQPECIIRTCVDDDPTGAIPSDECIDGENPLILDGISTYKIQAVNMAQGTSLRYRLTHDVDGRPLLRTDTVRVEIPINVLFHAPDVRDRVPPLADDDVYVLLLIDGVEQDRLTLPTLKNRKWYNLYGTSKGASLIELRVQNSYANRRDFFTDSWTVFVVSDNVEPPTMYTKVVRMPNQTATLAEKQQILTLAHPFNQSIVQSYDDVIGLMGLPTTAPDSSIILHGEHPDNEVARLQATGVKVVRHKPPVFTHWPTKFKVLNYEFGRSPEHYSQFPIGNVPKLKGHEGVDIVATLGSDLYAVNNGTVYRVDADAVGSAYGNSVRILLDNGVKVIYAHLTQPIVSVGQYVRGGQIIGYAGSTGKSDGPHLHLTTKIEGATARGETDFPYDIVDPTDWLLGFNPTRPHIEEYLAYRKVGAIDLAEYMLPISSHHWIMTNSNGAGERYYVLGTDRATRMIVKNHGWEEWIVDPSYIRLWRDSTPGNGRYYVVTGADGQRGGRWAKRHMKVGDTYVEENAHTVQFYMKSNCAESAENSGTNQNRTTLFKRHTNWRSPYNDRIVFPDVIEIGGDHEVHFFAKGFGRVGWRSAWGEAYITEFLDNNVALLNPEKIGCLNG